MNIRNFNRPPTQQERSAWALLVGPQEMPTDREEIKRLASESWKRRSEQCAGSIDALGVLIDAAEALDVFDGAIDTQTTSTFGKAPASLPKGFKSVAGERLSVREEGRRGAGNDED